MQIYEVGKAIFGGTCESAKDMSVAFSSFLSSPKIQENISKMSPEDRKRLRGAFGLYAEKSLALGKADQYRAYKNAASIFC